MEEVDEDENEEEKYDVESLSDPEYFVTPKEDDEEGFEDEEDEENEDGLEE